ncbi:glycosyltransferase [Roseovarius sp. LXJ103]|uniref:glycosyltransferase family 2 protein n=1 Tax=Roseovarius carneus TaxID=2853164 RepID=UPI000D61275E|nr:glycosyltransferase [Roseovarius carneus]MBZ8119742.1 glycosyltransferase [Roseovarius carneus]PWE34652.1 glycosyl transferase family 2 [Pelagicola sp. LXJ1103]
MTAQLRDREFSADEPVKVSICAITFNHQDYIAQCIEGFLDQVSDFRIEVLIHDDASTDGTADIIRDYAARHPTIFRTVLQTVNQYSKGVNPYSAYLIPDAAGKYIAFCDGDDYWCDPHKLATQAAALDAEPDVVLTYGPAQGISEVGDPVPYLGGITHDLSPAALKKAPPINTLTACFRNVFRGTKGSLFTNTATIGDLMVWGMLGYHGGGRYLSNLKPAFYRIRPDGLLSMKTPERQNSMTAVAHMHLAAYHEEQSDPEAATAAFNAMLQHSGSLLHDLPADQIIQHFETQLREMSPRQLFTLWRRSVKNKLLGG